MKLLVVDQRRGPGAPVPLESIDPGTVFSGRIGQWVGVWLHTDSGLAVRLSDDHIAVTTYESEEDDAPPREVHDFQPLNATLIITDWEHSE